MGRAVGGSRPARVVRSGPVALLVFLVLPLLMAACGSADPEANAVSSPDSTAEVETADADSTEQADGTEQDASTEQNASTGQDDESEAGEEKEGVVELFPDVVDVRAEQSGNGSWTFFVTLSSPYDTPERYADAWRVTGPDGEEYGVRRLTHDHQNEQPFTRSESGIVIPEGVTEVIVEGRDQVSGWGGETMRYQLSS